MSDRQYDHFVNDDDIVVNHDDCAGFGHDHHVSNHDVLIHDLVDIDQFDLDFIDDFLIDHFDHGSGFGMRTA